MATAGSISVTIHTRLFWTWVRTLRLLLPVLVPVLGERRVHNAAYAGRRLILVKVGERGRWHFLKPEA